jgi:uncharacterized protein involved in oxidation of intracellular sulfur
MTIIINDPPYGTERSWNALRLASSSASAITEEAINVFLLGDAVALAKRGQNPPEGYYNLEKMLSNLIKNGIKVRACGTCLAARGLTLKELVEGVELGTMLGLSKWIKESRVVLLF